MAVTKGKAPTKGAKQIVAENETTIVFYRNMSLVAALLYVLVCLVTHSDDYGYLNIALNVLVISLYVGTNRLMRYISKPTYAAGTGAVIDAGIDLNMEGGMGEHVKDVVILASLTHVLAAISKYFWFLLLLFPLRAVYLLWKHILGPWFFQAPDEPEEKNSKKAEKRMRHVQFSQNRYNNSL